MNRTISVICLLICITFSASAQSNSNSMALNDCIDYAMKNQTKLKSARYDEEIQIQKNNEIIGIARPQITANGQFQYLFILPKQRASADAFDFSSNLSFFKIDTPAYIAYQQQPKQKYSELQFGLPLNVSAGLQASQLLFDAGVFVALKARKSLEELSTLNTKRTEEDIRVSVSKAYYNCIIAEKRIKLLDENITLLSSIENTTRKLFDAGFAEKIDADRLTVQRNNLEIEKQKISNLIEVSYQLLKFQMGMPLQNAISLKDNLTIDEVKNGLELDRVVDYNNRVEMNLIQTAKKLNGYDYERYQKGYLTTLAAVVSGSYATQTQSFKDLFTYSYFPTGAFVLSATMPIYDGNTRKSKMNQAKLNILKNDNDMDAFRQAVDLESSNARTQLKNSLISLENQKSNIELAEKVYTIAQKKYKEGVGTNIEIIQAETALKDAQTNYFNSLFEAIIAKIDFQKSLGLLK
ncbi:MAG TPA: TolC family protein [Chitinophagaceae bacterium]|nr:TolC family protein [Chitinophagaceae bacterium]